MAQSLVWRVLLPIVALSTFCALRMLQFLGIVKPMTSYNYEDVCNALARDEPINESHSPTEEFPAPPPRHDVAVEEGQSLNPMDYYYLIDGDDLRLRVIDRATVRDKYILEYLVRCPYCDTWHREWRQNCNRCGAPLPNWKNACLREKPNERPVYRSTDAGVSWKPTGKFMGHMTLQGMDGDVGLETFSFDNKDSALVTFNNTCNNFCVARTNCYIVDIMIMEPSDGKLNLIVNGKITGVCWLIAGLQTSVNRRLAANVPIGAGAAIQLRFSP